jgi:hypothetical protein
MGLSKDSSVPEVSKMNQSEGCVVIMIVLTILFAVPSIGTNAFPLVFAFGLSSVAIAILHLAKTISDK